MKSGWECEGGGGGVGECERREEGGREAWGVRGGKKGVRRGGREGRRGGVKGK